MSTIVFLASASTMLRISLEDNNCTLTASAPGSVLHVEASDRKNVVSSNLSLKNAGGEEIWSASVTNNVISDQMRIRVDSIFPLVFGKDEAFVLCDPLMLSLNEVASRARYDLQLKMTLSSSSTICLPKIEIIHSANLIVEGEIVPVSKELLVIASQFFERLFYSNFQEKESGVYEIKDVPADDFRRLMNCFHTRNWIFSFLDRALLALRYADQFELLHLHSRVLPYLKTQKLPTEDIKDTLLLCSRFRDIDDLILWVLSQCGSLRKAQKVVQELHRQLPATALDAAFNALSVFNLDEKKQADSRVEQVLSLLQSRITSKEVVVHLQCFNEEQEKTHEDIFVLALNHLRNIRLKEIWNRVPEQYEDFTIPILGYKSRRQDDYSYSISTSILVVEARMN